MMSMETVRRIAVLAGAICGMLADAGRAADWPARLTIRGEERPVWPADDLRERGMDIAELDLKDNAARLYVEAINAYAELPDELEDVFRATLDDGLPRLAEGQRLIEWISTKENRRAIELAVKASRMDQCQFPYFGEPSPNLINVMLPSLSEFRHLAKMVVIDGQRLAAQGKADAALRNYQAAFRMGHHISQGCTLIESLVGIACAAIGIQAIEDQVLAEDIQPDQIEKIAEVLGTLADQLPNVRRGMAAERNFGLNMVDGLVIHPFSLVSMLQQMSGTGFPDDEAYDRDAGWSRLEARFGRLIIPDRTMKRHISAFYDEFERRGKLPAFEANWNDEFEKELIERVVPKWNMFARILLPSLARSNELSERLRATFGLLRTASTIRLHAIRNDGAWPSALNDLQSDLDAEAMIDPFSGKPFRYRRVGDGWILYSLSENLIDDGGVEDDDRNVPDMVLRFKPDLNKQARPERAKDED